MKITKYREFFGEAEQQDFEAGIKRMIDNGEFVEIFKTKNDGVEKKGAIKKRYNLEVSNQRTGKIIKVEILLEYIDETYCERNGILGMDKERPFWSKWGDYLGYIRLISAPGI